MNSILQQQMDAYALMKARQGIAREIVEYKAIHREWIARGETEAAKFCAETIETLFELAEHQFSHRPTIPPLTPAERGEDERMGWMFSNYGRA